MFIVKRGVQVVITSTPEAGDKIIDGPFADAEQAQASPAYMKAQRLVILAEGEEVRIHGPNGAYLFSIRNVPEGHPTTFHAIGFSGQTSEYETPVALYPWNESSD